MSLITILLQKKLLYEDISYDYVIENSIALIADSDVFLQKNSRKASTFQGGGCKAEK